MPENVDYKVIGELFEAAKKNKTVKRLAFGFEKVEAAWDKIAARANKFEQTHRNCNMTLRTDNIVSNVVLNDISFQMFYNYESNGPSSLYVALNNKKDYERIKASIKAA